MRAVRRCQDLPGQELFQYLDEDGVPRPSSSEDVNLYLREIAGEEITAKDFRTWAATNLAALAPRALQAFDSEAKARRSVMRAVEAVSKMLGNPPAICCKCDIHPAVLDGYLDGTLAEAMKRRADAKLGNSSTGLKAEEAAVMAFPARQLAAGHRTAGSAPSHRAASRKRSAITTARPPRPPRNASRLTPRATATTHG